MTAPIDLNAGATIDTARLPAMLTQLRLPTIARLWPAITEAANRESWPAARTLCALFEHEIAERAQRRTERHLLEAKLPVGKTVEAFDGSVKNLGQAACLSRSDTRWRKS